ncbi:hypothetical protein J6590_039144 [Homalodisca vitripennis]|nr:hypothetical protein J6590_039144 [Homalodisca vitripennis]
MVWRTPALFSCNTKFNIITRANVITDIDDEAINTSRLRCNGMEDAVFSSTSNLRWLFTPRIHLRVRLGHAILFAIKLCGLALWHGQKYGLVFQASKIQSGVALALGYKDKLYDFWLPAINGTLVPFPPSLLDNFVIAEGHFRYGVSGHLFTLLSLLSLPSGHLSDFAL